MDVRSVSRQAIDGYLSVLKFPVDLLAGRIGSVAYGRTDAQLAVDRIDAEIRDVVGKLLADEQMREDAARRRAASSSAAHLGRVRVQSGGVPVPSREPEKPVEEPKHIDDLRRRDDRIADLDVPDDSLGERAAQQLAEQELPEVSIAVTETREPRGTAT